MSSDYFFEDFDHFQRRISDLFCELLGDLAEMKRLSSDLTWREIIKKARAMAYPLTEAKSDLLQAGGESAKLFQVILAANEGKGETFRLSFYPQGEEKTIAHRAVMELIDEFDCLVTSTTLPSAGFYGDDYMRYAAGVICNPPSWDERTVFSRLCVEVGEAMRFEMNGGVGQRERPILPPKVARIYEILKDLPPYEGMTAPAIFRKLSDDHGINMDEGTFRNYVKKYLGPYGVEHTPRVGYRIKPSERPDG